MINYKVRGLIIFLLVIGGCAPKNYSPELKKLYNENTVINTLGLIQNAAIGLESKKEITTGDARLIITYTNTSLKIIRDKGTNWNESLLNAIRDLKESGLLQSVLDKFRTSLDLIETVIKELK